MLTTLIILYSITIIFCVILGAKGAKSQNRCKKKLEIVDEIKKVKCEKSML
jgi:hypothetical protein